MSESKLVPVTELLVLEPHDKFGHQYCRTASQARTDLENALMQMYNVKSPQYKCAITSSGMNAIAAVFDVMHRKDNQSIFVLGNEMFSQTYKACDYFHPWPQGQWMRENDKQRILVDVTDSDSIFALFQKEGKRIKLFFVESCSNPSGAIFEFGLISKLQPLAPECIFCVDNTWLTAQCFNPFEYGVHVVVESMTKYISAGTCIGGFVMGVPSVLDPVFDFLKHHGIFVGTDHCQLFLRGLKSLPDRIQYLSAVVKSVVHHLEVEWRLKVMHPRSEKHPSYFQSLLYLINTSAPACIWYHVPTALSRKKATVVLKAGPFQYATSYGGAKSRIDCWPEWGDSNMYGARDEQPKRGIWLRMALGYEDDLGDILQNLDQLLFQLMSDDKK
jgi:cystathionine beta-lyase/cystathionine gamma-synthase